MESRIQSEVIIIGAGVLGMSLAYHLARLGKRAIVFEREDAFAKHASGKNAGMIRQLYHHPQLTDWAERSIRLWPPEIASTVFAERGSIIVGRRVPRHHEYLFEQGELNDHGAARKHTPFVYTKSDGLVSPSEYATALRKLIDDRLVEFRFGVEVESIEPADSGWIVETANGCTATAPWVVNAAGPWVNRILHQSPELSVSVQPFARHLFVVDGCEKPGVADSLRSPSEVSRLNITGDGRRRAAGFCWDEVQGWYTRTWGESSQLFSICDKSPADADALFEERSPVLAAADDRTEDIMSEVFLKLDQAFPHCGVRIRDGWRCYRTYAEDQLPIWGEDPEAPGLFWLAAFGGFGMSTSFAACADAAEVIAGGTIRIPCEFLPARARLPGENYI